MGRFFNEIVSKMHKIPMGKTGKDSLEELRKKFNEELNAKSPEDTLKEKRRVNMAKARETKKRNKGNA